MTTRIYPDNLTIAPPPCSGGCMTQTANPLTQRLTSALQVQPGAEMQNNPMQNNAMLNAMANRIMWALANNAQSASLGTGCAATPMTRVAPPGCDGDVCGVPLGIFAVDVLPGETVDIEFSDDYPYTPETFVYTGPARTFTVLQVRNRGKTPVRNATPADGYSGANGVRAPAKWGKVSPSRPSVMTVRNDTAANATFAGATFGTSHQGETED